MPRPCQEQRYGRYRVGAAAIRKSGPTFTLADGTQASTTSQTKSGINPIVVVGIGLAALFLLRR